MITKYSVHRFPFTSQRPGTFLPFLRGMRTLTLRVVCTHRVIYSRKVFAIRSEVRKLRDAEYKSDHMISRTTTHVFSKLRQLSILQPFLGASSIEGPYLRSVKCVTCYYAQVFTRRPSPGFIAKLRARSSMWTVCTHMSSVALIRLPRL